MDTLLTVLMAAPIVILLFGASIFLHEFGHYWVARKLGLKVEEFAIGFGPIMKSWERDGIVYSIRWIPAGGFVKLPQMLTSEMLEGSAEDAGDEIPPAPPFAKVAVALAGPAMNIVFAFAIGCLLFFTGVPKLVNPAIVGEVEPGSAEEQLGIQVGDRIVKVNHKNTDTWQDIILTCAIARTNFVPVEIAREVSRDADDQPVYETKTYQLELIGGEKTAGLKMFALGSGLEPVVGEVFPGTPAEKADLQSNDKILTFNGLRVVSQAHMQRLVAGSKGEEAALEIERNGAKLTKQLTPEIMTGEKAARIGIRFAVPDYKYLLQKPGPMPWERIHQVYEQTVGTLGALIHSKKTGVGLSDMSGPAGILSMLTHWVLTDYRLALDFLILLNVNLAILNMMPIPVLDGGHTVMGVIEAFVSRFWGKKAVKKVLNIRVIEYTTMAFAIALLSVMAYVTFFDIKRLPLFKSMFESKTVIEQPAEAGE